MPSSEKPSKTTKQVAGRTTTTMKRGKLKPNPAAQMTPDIWASEVHCNVPKLCVYMQLVSDYLQWLAADHQKLRIAVCNVEDQAFGTGGNPNKPPRYCSGGGTNEPSAPPPPPVW